MAAAVRSAIVMAACLLISSCSETVTASTTQPLAPPTEASTTTSQGDVASSPPSGRARSTVELDFGVSQITAAGSGLFGLAVQDFEAPASLIDEEDTGCVGFQAGRTGEVVWSDDGLAWVSLPTQPSWYHGPLAPEDWGEVVASGLVPPSAGLVVLVSNGDRLLAISFEELTPTRATAEVDTLDPSTVRWQRLGSLGSVRSDTSAVAAATGPKDLLIVAARPDGSPGAWKVGDGGLLELSGAFDSWTDEGESWIDEVSGVELVASADGFLAQFEVPARAPLMAFSADGSSWTRVSHPSTGPVRLAASGETVLAANGDGMWISTDSGQVWTPVPIEEGAQFFEIAGAESGFAAWYLTEDWSSPTVLTSVDGIDWEPVLELSNDYNWINGLWMTDDEIIVSASAPSNGWVCPEVERFEYEIHIVQFE